MLGHDGSLYVEVVLNIVDVPGWFSHILYLFNHILFILCRWGHMCAMMPMGKSKDKLQELIFSFQM